MKYYSEINLLVGAKTKTQSYTQSFDAWGRERNPQTWDYTPNPSPKPAWLIRGYTGHEMLPEFGLINMNGRMYDPVLGRMLSPDNFVQDPSNTQSYNRYSYCWNNPLKYTDPSGEILTAMFFAVGYITDLASNLINGVANPFSQAYHNVTSMITGMNNAAQFTVYESNNTTVKAGLSPFNLGVGANATHKEGEFTFNLSGGVGASGGFINGGVNYQGQDWGFGLSGGYGGNDWRVGGGVSYKGAFLGATHFGGKDAQWNWIAGYQKGDFRVAMTNDAFLDPGDKFRTAALDVSYREMSLGFNIYTTKPNDRTDDNRGGDDFFESPIHGKNEKYGTYVQGERIHAGLYFGYNDGMALSRVGIDAAFVQDLFQNGVHRWLVRGPYFNTNLGPSPRFFGQYIPFNPWTLY